MGSGIMTFVTGTKNPSATLLLRGGTQQVLNGLERALDDALHAVADVVEDGKLVAGGGAPEIELSLRLREYASTLKGREQLAVTKFAEAMEIVPKTLAENAGFDAIDKTDGTEEQAWDEQELRALTPTPARWRTCMSWVWSSLCGLRSRPFNPLPTLHP